ncbi:type III restriction endonuclease subunit M [Mycoplasmopsis pulmonis]|uniref:type III restriction endonuclease subunit M n=1 Tax=Mycoplasmopsis pulmonis TaxID=2107 RepID=UPI002ACEE20E|nr:type III restriction endonuclease subunit M [Mycoplasmopsis pulmonis]MDZ7293510.1 type III restriction endonuclease subunit M [Mycoplasmopsis pulmonis]
MEKYKKYLDELEQHWNNKYINEDQKEMMKSLFEKIKDDDHILQETKKLLLQRVKLGFRFDIAPEPDKTQISLLIKDKQMSIQNDILEQDNQLIIGENYDALKNLIVIERERERERPGK